MLKDCRKMNGSILSNDRKRSLLIILGLLSLLLILPLNKDLMKAI